MLLVDNSASLCEPRGRYLGVFFDGDGELVGEGDARPDWLGQFKHVRVAAETQHAAAHSADLCNRTAIN